MSRNSNSSATGSALMRLPAEIRRMILRMVIGDNLIHIYHCEVSSYCSRCMRPSNKAATDYHKKRGNGYIDESAENEGQYILTHRVCHSEITISCGRSSTSPVPPWPNSTSGFDLAHRNCANLSKYRRDNYLDFRIFETSRQIYQEAFTVFWRTSRFAFEQGDVLAQYLGNLSESQRHNLQSIVICHRFRASRLDLERHLAFATVKSKWTSCFRRREGAPSPRSLKSVELHLSLCRNSDGVDYLQTFRTHLKAFEPLGLLSLDEASVTVSVIKRIDRKPVHLENVENEEMRSLAQSFRDRLLNPTITKQDMADTLQDEIKGLEYSVRTSESKGKALLRQVADLQAQADRLQAQANQQQLKADEDRDEWYKLQRVLIKNDPSEMGQEIQLRTGAYLELSGSDGENTTES